MRGNFVSVVVMWLQRCTCFSCWTLLSLMMVQLISTCTQTKADCYRGCDTGENWMNLSVGPFLFGQVQPLRNLGKSDMYRQCRHCIDKRSNMTIKEFWEKYDGKWPVIIRDIVPQWKAYKYWDKEFFLQKYSENKVLFKSVYGKLKSGTANVCDMKTFIASLKQPSNQTSWRYMEDEMFLIDKPQLRQDIGRNYIQTENFFHLFPKEIQPWDCMMLWGTKYSHSTLHMDPYNWTAISAVIWGKKHWKLFPPGQDQYLYIQPNVKCGFPLECNKYDSPVDGFDVDYVKYPKFMEANYIEVEQNRGELLVIPSGWFHQAFNDEETLSISTQLMNRNNFQIILDEIIKGNSLSKQTLPRGLSEMPPSDQVKVFMSVLPSDILEKGMKVTERVLANLK